MRVVREDPEKAGLLYAGGEAGMYVSFDAGANWQSLDLNLPPVPITDLAIRQSSLVAATQGRGFWVLDDLSVIQQLEAGLEDNPIHLFSPGTVEKMVGGGWKGAFEGANPDRGVVLNYHIAQPSDESLVITISDEQGEVVREYHSEEGPFERCALSNMDQRFPFSIKYPGKEVGSNRWVWDLRRNGLNCIEDLPLFEGFAGASVGPGTYTIQMAMGEWSTSATVNVVADRRMEAGAAEFADLDARLVEVTTMMNEILGRIDSVRQSRQLVESLVSRYPQDQDLHELAERVGERLDDWEASVLQVEYETYEDEDSLPPRLVKQVRHLLDVLDSAGPPVAAGALERLADLKSQWAARKQALDAIWSSDVAAVNLWAKERDVPHVIAGPQG